MRYLADYTTGRENNFNLIRFLAASAVVFSHSYPISGHIELEPVARLLGGFMDLATVGVVVFFALSGLLIAQSWDRLGNFLRFVKARAIRLLPGLIVVTLFTALVVGPLATSYSLFEYFGDRGFVRYLADSLRLEGTLPGVFAGNPIPWAINGSLWTITVEVCCYAALMVMGALGVIRRPWLTVMVVLAGVCAYGFWPQWIREHMPKGESYMAPSLVGVFFVGAVFYAFRRRVPVSRVIALIGLGGLYLAWGTFFTPYVFYFVFAYCIFIIAYHPSFDVPTFRKLGDYSYGIYIFAFPIQQLVIAKAGLLGPLHLFAYSFPLTLLLAMLSWHLVEHPALRWKEKGLRSKSSARDFGRFLLHRAKKLGHFLPDQRSTPMPQMAASGEAPDPAQWMRATTVPERRTRLAAALFIVAALAIAITLSWRQHRAPPVSLPTGTVGAVETPADEVVIASGIRISGWALDPAGMRGVEIRVDARAYPARYGVARADVAQVKPGYPDSAEPGFSFEGDFGSLDPARHEIVVVAVNRQGGETVLARKSLLPPAAFTQWQPHYLSRHADAAPPFFVLPGLSGIALGGASELDKAYSNYLSPTVSVGMRVPILYLRTTLGKTRDWDFDPAWNIERRCGERRIAEDSLSGVIAHAIEHKLPVLFTLNGGVWADAACDVPEWDVNDHLEQDKANCQWNEHDQVMADDYLKDLPGASAAPELGRSLTFNIYATQNRHYKRRNLQSAGRIVAEFATAHPELFAGVNLDPDTYLNPFFEEKQWYDYNPGTLRQFRQWLAGSGPYAMRPARGGPDLSRYRRARPLSLAEVRKLSGKRFGTWDEVDPPRAFPREGKPFWEDPWMHEWEVFRRHLVKLHYDELSQWLADAGVAPSRIFSSQGFIAPYPTAFPFAVRLDSPTKNYDSGGMSVEGAIPRDGHLGAIVYGASAVNDVRMENDANLFATFHRMDRGWGVVEFNTADFRTPKELPSYAMGYRALREMFNYGARFASPMAWNGSNGLYAGQAGYVSFMAWRNTPVEDAMRDFAVSHAFVPLGARLWTFGSPRLAHADGWSASVGTLAAGPGYVDLTAVNGEVTLVSPSPLALGGDESDLLTLGVAADQVQNIIGIAVEGRLSDGTTIALALPRAPAELAQTSAGLSVPLLRPAAPVTIDRISITLKLLKPGGMLHLRHIALFPPAPLTPSR